jgi:hypothetical protein
MFDQRTPFLLADSEKYLSYLVILLYILGLFSAREVAENNGFKK